MADVRSMLRAERANRRITHPNAAYTTDGKISCNLCETVIKSEAAWGSHLHSTQHTLRLSRAQDAAVSRGVAETPVGKKRKAESLDSPVAGKDERKRARPGDGPREREVEATVSIGGEDVQQAEGKEEKKVDEEIDAVVKPVVDEETKGEMDEAEMAAFERELEDLEASVQAEAGTAGVNASATISAAPMSAEELAAKAREEQSSQRGRRDVEIQDDKEDAERLLEDEIVEMEGLEERVRKLKERREALRTQSDGNKSVVVNEQNGRTGDQGEREGNPAGDEEEDDDDDDDDDLDEWQFGAA